MSTAVPAARIDVSEPFSHSLLAQYEHVRRATEALCTTLETEDYVVQSMPDASPVKWHLAHTSWFFETFILAPEGAAGPPDSAGYSYLFNSYYNAVGDRIPRARRGLLSRPTVAEVYTYRAAVDDRMRTFLADCNDRALDRLSTTIALGLNHEQQHQELILTDLKHAFAANPLFPIFRDQPRAPAGSPGPLRWAEHPGGVRSIGHRGTAFAFDNEGPRHEVFVQPHLLADRLVTNGEYLAFIADGGYERPEFWLSDGWNTCQTQRWRAPLYWQETGTSLFSLGGLRDIEESEPVCHISFYEADAYARWAGARLPTEAEWELAAGSSEVTGNFVESGHFHPIALSSPLPAGGPVQLFGDVWEWTQSAYSPYPGYRPAVGALGEYNGKFMCNQIVLRGGSCATPRSHIRSTYRNFFPPDARWQFSGIRLAQDVEINRQGTEKGD
ncbi:MAG: ergothioneine biosynthesis protein EgtB [Isosphaeraceae bacterium]|nr:ergothioneine biosynthesis protein EgtB [Isosphaeraceae bacterium]